MNKGIEILLARMESNPDEFMGVGNKWLKLMESYEDYMVEEERKALYAKYSTLHMDKFTEHVMKKLLEEQQEKSNRFGEAYQQQYANAMNAAQQRSAVMNQAAQLGGGLGQYALGNATTSSGAVLTSDGSGVAFNSIQHPRTELRVGEQSLTEKTIKQLKKLASLQR